MSSRLEILRSFVCEGGIPPATDRQKQRARSAAALAVRDGRLMRPKQCEINDENCHGKIQLHHWRGYATPYWLDVRWLCTTHHRWVEDESRSRSK